MKININIGVILGALIMASGVVCYKWEAWIASAGKPFEVFTCVCIAIVAIITLFGGFAAFLASID